MGKYEQVANSGLKQGDKITLVAESEFGGMWAVQSVFDHAEISRHYQNCPESMYGVRIYHKPKGKRKLYASNISHNVPFAIYRGWVDIDTESIIYNIKPLTEEDKAVGIIQIRESKYGSFDPRYFTDLKKIYPDYLIFDMGGN